MGGKTSYWRQKRDSQGKRSIWSSVVSRNGKVSSMKHKVTVEVEVKKRFLGIPYKTTEKKRIMVDGKTYRKMKQEERDQADRMADEALACAAIVWEEEMVDMFGE